jgi:hypothetical protein
LCPGQQQVLNRSGDTTVGFYYDFAYERALIAGKIWPKSKSAWRRSANANLPVQRGRDEPPKRAIRTFDAMGGKNTSVEIYRRAAGG